MTKGDRGSTADWFNAAANFQQARALNSMNESMQYQNNLLSQQNTMLNSQQIKIANIANARRLIIDFETRLPELTSLAVSNPEFTVCLLAEMEIELSTASKCFEEFEDIERSKTTLGLFTQLNESIRSKFDNAQNEVIKILPTIPNEINDINELINYNSEAESLIPKLNHSNKRNKVRRRLSVIPIILILIICPLIFLSSVMK